MHDRQVDAQARVAAHTKRKSGAKMTAKERAAAKKQFLEAMQRTANVTAACQQAGISRAIVYQWKEHDLEFGVLFEEANKQANDVLFAEGWRRALYGDEEYVISGGKVVLGPDGKPLKKRVRSDTLLALYLKARLPEFREKGPTVVALLPKEYINFDPDQDGVDR